MTEKERPVLRRFWEWHQRKASSYGFCLIFFNLKGKNSPLRPGRVTMWQLESTPH